MRAVELLGGEPCPRGPALRGEGRKGRVVKVVEGGTDLMDSTRTNPTRHQGRGSPCSRHHRSMDPSPPAPAATAQSCGHLLGQGTFWCWWVQRQELISQTFPLHS